MQVVGSSLHLIIYCRYAYRSRVSYWDTFWLFFLKKCFKGNAKLMICYCGELSYYIGNLLLQNQAYGNIAPYVDFYI